MERISPRDRLLNALEKTKNGLDVLDVSLIKPDGNGARVKRYFNVKDLYIIDKIPIVSNNYVRYKLATEILGPGYYYLADYYLIILEIKKGDPEYIKELAKTNYPALVSNAKIFDFALEILGPDYEYLINYYDLAISIRDDDYRGVMLFLEENDPRDNNDFSYRISLQYGNQKYIDLIREKIIERDWLEQQVLENMFGTESPYKDIYQYMKKL